MYQIDIKAEEFRGKRMVGQHQMVNEVKNKLQVFIAMVLSMFSTSLWCVYLGHCINYLYPRIFV